jgi:myo-inositol 2-dehydrogenase/D-chiro-inositol 1-dehydrogenase
MVFRLGLAGGGRMGRTHLRALKDSTDVQIVAVAEPYEPSAEELRALGLAVHPTLETMLEAGGIDGVLVATPSNQHLSVVELIAQAGLPILCEKPCGISPAQAHAAGEAARRGGVFLQVAYWRRFIPALQELQKRIQSGEEGNIHLVICAQWDEAPPPARFRANSGGIFIDMGVHEIDQLRWLTGQEVIDVSVSAFPTLEDPEASGDVDSAQALLTLSNGTTGVISLGRFFPGGDQVAAEVYGSRGHTRVEVLQPSDGEAPQLEALRLQAESFARAAHGGAVEGASIEDAEAALAVAGRLSGAAGLAILGEKTL